MPSSTRSHPASPGTLHHYAHYLARDIPAGVVVFLVALPLCLGIALASGAPLLAGLMAGVIGGLVVAFFSGSQLSVSGPAAGLVVIVIEAIATLGGFSGFLVAVMLAGALQLIFACLRAGDIGSYVPSPVIKGMLAAIGLLLMIKQLPVALGVTSFDGFASRSPNEIGLTDAALHAVGIVSGGTVAVALTSLLILALWETRWVRGQPLLRAIPGPLLVVAWGALYQIFAVHAAPEAALEAAYLVQLPAVDGLGSLAAQLTRPDFSQLASPAVYTVAITLAIVASLETLLSLEAVDKLDPLRRVAPSNRELYAQGIGNIAAGFLGALPLTAVIVRSSANINAGGRTKIAAIVHGLLLLGSVLFLSNALRWIPLAALSAILLHVGYKLAKPTLFVEAWRKGPTQAAPFIITIAAILATDLLVGIAIGMAVGLAFVVRTKFHRTLSLTRYEDCYLLRLHKDVSFFNKAQLRRYLARVEPNSKLVIDTSRCRFIDLDIGETIADFLHSAPASNIAVTLRSMPRLESPHCDAMRAVT
jgi:MFS superfamily sulfate permease-like transporter